VANESVQTLDARGHSPGGNSRNFGHFPGDLFKRGAVGDVSLVSFEISLGQRGILAKFFLQFGH
jgi:hypothetical protein